MPQEIEPVSFKSVWELIKQTASSWSDINAPRLGASLAYYTILSIAPLLVVCIGIAGLVFAPEAAQNQIAGQISGLTGSAGADVIQELIKNASKPASGIAATVAGV